MLLSDSKKNYFRPEYWRTRIRYDRPKKCPTIWYVVKQWLKPVSATGARQEDVTRIYLMSLHPSTQASPCKQDHATQQQWRDITRCFPVSTKHLYNMYTMFIQRRILGRRYIHVIQMFCVYWVQSIFNRVSTQHIKDVKKRCYDVFGMFVS